MKNRIVRAVSLYAFTVVVLLAIGLLMPQVSVGWHALWAGVVLTAAALLIKPLLTKIFRNAAAKSASDRTRVGEKVVQYVLVFLVELIIWVLTVIFSGVHVRGFFWGYVLPPLALLIAWIIYDAIDDRIEAKAGQLYDRVGTSVRGASRPDASPSTPGAPTTKAAREELADGLTPEQRRLLDEL
ncbi:hypothetical protein ACWIBQ_09405 [Microbacterium keratanolyticum]